MRSGTNKQLQVLVEVTNLLVSRYTRIMPSNQMLWMLLLFARVYWSSCSQSRVKKRDSAAGLALWPHYPP
jgi:hypothetical protein